MVLSRIGLHCNIITKVNSLSNTQIVSKILRRGALSRERHYTEELANGGNPHKIFQHKERLLFRVQRSLAGITRRETVNINFGGSWKEQEVIMIRSVQ